MGMEEMKMEGRKRVERLKRGEIQGMRKKINDRLEEDMR